MFYDMYTVNIQNSALFQKSGIHSFILCVIAGSVFQLHYRSEVEAK